MDHRIVCESSGFYRAVARQQLRGNWVNGAIAAAIFVVITGVMDFVVMNLMNNQATVFLSGIYAWLVFGPAIVGLYAYYMNLVRGQNPSIGNCFEGFERFGRAFLLGLFMILFIVLWTMLFIIPGIVAAYRYSLAPMLLRDRPELGALDCIRESKRLMTGNKSSMFVLDLTFLGWMILASVPMIVVQTILMVNGGDVNYMMEYQPDFIDSVILLVSQIPLLWVFAYNYTAKVVFYEEVIKPVPQPHMEYTRYTGEESRELPEEQKSSESRERNEENDEADH